MANLKESVALGAALEDGSIPVFRQRDGKIEGGLVRPLESGQPLPPDSDVVSIKGRVGSPLHTMETVYKSPGPSKASNKSYRKGWNRVFGGSKSSKSLLN